MSTEAPTPAPVPAASEPADPLADLPGVDLSVGLRSVAGKRELYLQLLRMFASGHGHDAEHLPSAPAEGRLDDARHQAHGLKGVAAPLGALALSDAARAVEDTLKAHLKDAQTPLPDMAPLLATLEAQLFPLLAAPALRPA